MSFFTKLFGKLLQRQPNLKIVPQPSASAVLSGVDYSVPLIKEFEQCRLEAYQDSAGIWTIGYGHTDGVRKGDKITQAQADMLFLVDLEVHTKSLNEILAMEKFLCSPNQYAALLSFRYNMTISGTHTLLRGRTPEQVASAMLLYHKSGGKPVRGLKIRRAVEQALFLLPPGQKFDIVSERAKAEAKFPK